MLEQEIFTIADPQVVRRVIVEQPWATLVSHTTAGLCVSHLPVLVADDPAGLAVVGHLARPDGDAHELGTAECVLIVQGPNGYLSPSWYGEEPHVPTWNFVVVHLYGVAQPLDDDATFQVLSDTVDHLEARLAEPWSLDRVPAYARRIAPGTVGFRLEPGRTVAKAKLSQDESADLGRRSIAMLRADHAYRDPDLAAWMESTLGDR